MRLIPAALFLVTSLSAEVNPLAAKEISDGWLTLFDGETLFGWTVEGGAKWRVANGTIVADAGEYGWLRTNTQFGDYVLKLEFQTAADGNSGVFFAFGRRQRSSRGRV